jgi:HEAT repeat protein
VEQILASEGDLGARLAASETLGNLGDTRSLPVLQAVLASQQRKDERGRGRGADGGLSLSAVLAIGKLGDPSAVPDLMKLAKDGNDLALHSTVVHALGLIGGHRVIGALTEISKTHPNQLIREQAQLTLEQIRRERKRSTDRV